MKEATLASYGRIAADVDVHHSSNSSSSITSSLKLGPSAGHALAMSIIVETEANSELQKVDTATNKNVIRKKNEITVRHFLFSLLYPWKYIQSTHPP